MPKPSPTPHYISVVDEDLNAQIYKRFKIVCVKCGNNNATIDIQSRVVYSEHTINNGSVSIGCGNCLRSLVIDIGS